MVLVGLPNYEVTRDCTRGNEGHKGPCKESIRGVVGGDGRYVYPV